MTFSILAVDSETGAVGAAAATGNLAVGAWVIRAAADGGAVATQGMSTSSLWGDDALDRLRTGQAPDAIVADLTGADAGRDHRQLSVIDLEGRGAAWTGASNQDFKMHVVRDGLVLAGNWLATDEVLPAAEAGFTASKGPLADRLMAALRAGASSGGDARGLMSAAIRIVSRTEPPLDFRVDLSDDPLAALATIIGRSRSPDYTGWLHRVPVLDAPSRT